MSQNFGKVGNKILVKKNTLCRNIRPAEYENAFKKLFLGLLWNFIILNELLNRHINWLIAEACLFDQISDFLCSNQKSIGQLKK